MSNILIIEEDSIIRGAISTLLRDVDAKIIAPKTTKEAIKKLAFKNQNIKVAIIGQVAFASTTVGQKETPAKNIIDIFFKNRSLPLPCIFVTIPEVYGNREDAKYAVSHGAWDYISMPIRVIDKSQLKAIIKEDYVLLREGTEKQNDTLILLPQLIKNRLCNRVNQAISHNKQLQITSENLKKFRRKMIVGNSKELTSCLYKAFAAAQGDENVLITGETGTGKELIAQAIHGNSYRKGKPIVEVNCAAITDTIAESLLFGTKKGVASDVEKQKGYFIQANGGSLFFDEVGDLSHKVQTVLLRALQEKKVTPLGGEKSIDINVRFIFATNQNLDQMAHEGKFRKDLLHRINTISIQCPPLRNRKEDIEPLAEYFLKEAKTQNPKSGVDDKDIHMDAEFVQALRLYDWPGNVRELKNIIHSAVSSLTGEERSIHLNSLPFEIKSQWIEQNFYKETTVDFDNNKFLDGINKRGTVFSIGQAKKSNEKQKKIEELTLLPEFSKNTPAYKDGDIKNFRPWEEVKREKHCQYLKELIEAAKYNIKEAARKYGCSTSNFYKKLRENGISSKPGQF